jgi:voltage-gated potassium channel Kch
LNYFSLTTITTTGYGDFVPVDPIARSLANLEAVFGQLFPATLLARLVALHVAHSGDAARALRERKQEEDKNVPT